ncbi:MAG: YicC family protein [Candidatus Binatia bacterium]|nr:YicC family protein [Candidatus Binatia bacterium]
MKSMTGFGGAQVAAPGGRVTVEVKSVNSRFLELRIGLPREQQVLEADLRKIVQACVERGRVEVSVRREGRAGRKTKVEADLKLAREITSAWKRVGKELKLPGDLDLAFLRSAAGDIVRTAEETPEPAKDATAIRTALKRALQAHDRERVREGAHLEKDMKKRLKALVRLRARAAKLAGTLRKVLMDRLNGRIADLMGEQAPEPARIVQEVALAVDRGDVSEELARLESHLAALGDLLDAQDPVGKRIEFLLQEILREVNTVGSKANHLPMTETVLEAKGEIEKLREQVANVE